MGCAAQKEGGQPPRAFGALPRDIYRQYEINDFLMLTSQNGWAVQGGIPMTAQCESTAPPPINRPEARCRSYAPLDFILAINIPAGGSPNGNPLHAGEFR